MHAADAALLGQHGAGSSAVIALPDTEIRRQTKKR